jgi:hypothetical protein
VLDGVELRASAGRWPAGRLGTVLEVFPDGVMVEIADNEGRTLEILSLPSEAVAVLPTTTQERLL